MSSLAGSGPAPTSGAREPASLQVASSSRRVTRHVGLDPHLESGAGRAARWLGGFVMIGRSRYLVGIAALALSGWVQAEPPSASDIAASGTKFTAAMLIRSPRFASKPMAD